MKKSIALFLASILVFTLFAGIGVQPAFAEDGDGNVSAIVPRSNDNSGKSADGDSSGTTAAPSEDPKQTDPTISISASLTTQSVAEGGSVSFSVTAANVRTVEWKLVAASGSAEYDLENLRKTFSGLETQTATTNDNTYTLRLKNVPADMDGWKVKVHLANNDSSADATATLAVTKPAPTETTKATEATTEATKAKLEVTKSPTKETVEIGGTALFVAKAKNADKITWRMISKDGQKYTIEEAAKKLSGLRYKATEADDKDGVKKYVLTLSSIPESADGWMVDAVFEGGDDSKETDAAKVTVTAKAAETTKATTKATEATTKPTETTKATEATTKPTETTKATEATTKPTETTQDTSETTEPTITLPTEPTDDKKPAKKSYTGVILAIAILASVLVIAICGVIIFLKKPQGGEFADGSKRKHRQDEEYEDDDDDSFTF